MFGPFGPYGNQFPYSNFHDLNLDWIIKCVRDNNVSVAEFAEQLTEMGVKIDEFQEYIDSLDETIDQKINEELPEAIQHEVETGGFNQVLSLSHKRRVVFIGDSYAQGWSPDGRFDSWCTVAAGILGLASADYIVEAEGGAGFGLTSSEGRKYIPTLVQAAYDNISNPITVTDIVIGLGYNDNTFASDYSTVTTGINSTMTLIKTLFPYARVYLFAVGFTTNVAKQINLCTIYNKAYAPEYQNYGYANISESLNHVSFFASDGIHPVQAGHNRLGNNVARIMNGGQPNYYQTLLSAASVDFSLVIGNEDQAFDGCLAISPCDGELHLTTQGQFKVVEVGNSGTFTMSGNTAVKLAKLTGMGDYTGYFLRQYYVTTTGKMFGKVSGSGDFTDWDIALTLATDSNKQDVFLYVTVLGASGSGFKKAQNVTHFGFQGIDLRIPFITNQKPD